MSNFACEYCGAVCLDTPIGYVTGCEHYPADVMMRECASSKAVRYHLTDKTSDDQEPRNVAFNSH